MSPVFTVCGWVGQAAFSWRTILQWWASERAGGTVIPRTYWTWSLVGAVLTLAYALGRRDPVFVLGALASGFIFARNAWLDAHHEPGTVPPKPAVWPLLAGFGLFGLLAAWNAPGSAGAFAADVPVAWSVIGFLGQLAWSGRFVVQWRASEARGRSVLPGSFFSLGFLGSLVLTAYALYRQDWVNVAAHALCPVPYGRNLVMRLRAARETASAAVPSPREEEKSRAQP